MKPPTSAGTMIFTSIMLAVVVLMVALAISPSHFLFFSSVWSTVGW